MIAAYVEAHPDQLVRVKAGWLLDKAGPDVMRELVETWQHEAGLRSVLGAIAEQERTGIANSATPAMTEITGPKGDAQLGGLSDTPAPNAPAPSPTDRVQPIGPSPSGETPPPDADGQDGRGTCLPPNINDPGTISR